MTNPCHDLSDPSEWVMRWAPSIAARERVLDVACGAGRHTRYLAGMGYGVEAVDRDISPLGEVARLAEVTVSCHDLENAPWPYPDLEFGGIVVVNYLFRPLFPALIKSLKKGGILIYETFTSGNERYGKPRNPDHLLRHGELLEVARGQLRVMAYEDLFVTHPKPAMIQHICAVKIVPPDSIG